MSNNDTLANVLSQINNAIKVGKSTVQTNISSKLIKQVLQQMKDTGYLADVQEIQDSKGNYLVITLNGKLNTCGAIKPRFSISLGDFEKFEKSYLPARGFGFLVVSTNQGLLNHDQAKEKKIGGRLISYYY